LRLLAGRGTHSPYCATADPVAVRCMGPARTLDTPSAVFENPNGRWRIVRNGHDCGLPGARGRARRVRWRRQMLARLLRQTARRVGCRLIRHLASGGQGGNGFDPGYGGQGAQVQASFPVASGETLGVLVGGARPLQTSGVAAAAARSCTRAPWLPRRYSSLLAEAGAPRHPGPVSPVAPPPRRPMARVLMAVPAAARVPAATVAEAAQG